MAEPLSMAVLDAARSLVHACEIGVDTADEYAALLDAVRAAAPSGEPDELREIEKAARDYVEAERRWLEAGLTSDGGKVADEAMARLRAALHEAPDRAAGLREAAQKVVSIWASESGESLDGSISELHAALLSEPPLDVERLADAIFAHQDSQHGEIEYPCGGECAAAIAAEYARLTEDSRRG